MSTNTEKQVHSTKCQDFYAQEQLQLLTGSHHGSEILMMKNKLKDAINKSDSKFFYVKQIQDNWKLNHLKIYNNKEDVLLILKELFNPTDERKKPYPVEVFEVTDYNVFNRTNTDNGHTNLSILTRLNKYSVINLYFEKLGYILDCKHYGPDHLTRVKQLEDMLLKTNIYPTTGDAQDGTLKFAPEVEVYKVLAKL